MEQVAVGEAAASCGSLDGDPAAAFQPTAGFRDGHGGAADPLGDVPDRQADSCAIDTLCQVQEHLQCLEADHLATSDPADSVHRSPDASQRAGGSMHLVPVASYKISHEG